MLTGKAVEIVRRDRRRRRWVVRICLSLLLLLAILTAVVFVLLSSSGMTVEQADAVFAQLKSNETQEQAERLMGPPHRVISRGKSAIWYWFYRRQSFNCVDDVTYYADFSFDGLMSASGTSVVSYEGKLAWLRRWEMLKDKLGWQ